MPQLYLDITALPALAAVSGMSLHDAQRLALVALEHARLHVDGFCLAWSGPSAVMGDEKAWTSLCRLAGAPLALALEPRGDTRSTLFSFEPKVVLWNGGGRAAGSQGFMPLAVESDGDTLKTHILGLGGSVYQHFAVVKALPAQIKTVHRLGLQGVLFPWPRPGEDIAIEDLHDAIAFAGRMKLKSGVVMSLRDLPLLEDMPIEPNLVVLGPDVWFELLISAAPSLPGLLSR